MSETMQPVQILHKSSKNGLLIITLLLLSCGPSQPVPTEKPQPIIPNGNSIAYIELLQGDSCLTIRDSLTINNFTNNINNAKPPYVKFGVHNKFTFYDSASNILTEGGYNGNYIKIASGEFKAAEKIGW